MGFTPHTDSGSGTHLRIGVEGHNYGSHLAVLGEDELLCISALQTLDELSQLARCIPNTPKLVVGNLDSAHCPSVVVVD